MTRIDAIRSLLGKTPDDVFLHYSLGMELAKAGQVDEALAEMDACVRLDAGYLPAKVERGKILRAAGRLDEAREAFLAAQAAAAGQQHVQDFVQQQLESLG